MITVQPIRYTTDPHAWHALATALGLVALPGGSDDWTEFAGGSGVLAIHRVASESDVRTDLNLLTDDLDELAARLGNTARHTTLDDIGPMLVVDGPPPFTATTIAGPLPDPSMPLAVLPIWYGRDLEASGRLLDRVPLHRRIASDSGGWIDFRADGGGLVALHVDDDKSGVELSFEYAGPLEDLAARLVAGGFTPAIVDETYSRTLRVAIPEGPQLWVNETQEDLYGYRRLD